MSDTSPFSGIDTVIVRVKNLGAMLPWYEKLLGAKALFTDDEERLAVLPVGSSGSITLWELKPDESAGASPSRAGTYPILAVPDADAAHSFARGLGARVESVASGDGVRFFGFEDPDGNYLEACQVLG